VNYKFRVLLWTAAEAANFIVWSSLHSFFGTFRLKQMVAGFARIAGRREFDTRPGLTDDARMNYATKAANFTRENAGEMARRATASRLARIAREKAEGVTRAAAPVTEDARKRATLRQLDKLDLLIDAALEAGEKNDFLRLSAAKERLWKLVQPTAGTFRPRQPKDSRRYAGSGLRDV
jgi:hypothetical protein